MPKGIKGFQKGHKSFSEKGRFQKGFNHKPESIEKIRASSASRKFSNEVKMKASERMKNNNPAKSIEVARKISLSNKGRKPWNWSGNPVDEIRKARNSAECNEWRLKVFQRDNFTCKMPGCDKSEKYLEAHHIKRFAQFKELRFEINNGITLCKKCHNKTRVREEKFESLFYGILGFDGY